MLKRYHLTAIGGCCLYIIELCPGVWYFYLAANVDLRFNPDKDFEYLLSSWPLHFLCLAFLTPLQDLFGINLIAYRRALGLIAFYYMLAHFAVHLNLDRGLALGSILGDILCGNPTSCPAAGLVMLIPLSLILNRLSIRKLVSHWNTLHKLA